MFIVTLLGLLVLVHGYLWLRLVRDTTVSRRWRRSLGALLAALLALLVATLTVPDALGVAEPAWLAWPGYLWMALAGYLVLALLAVEPVRLLGRWSIARRARAAQPAPPTDTPAAPPPDAASPSAVSRRLFLARAGATAAGAASIGLVGAGTLTATGSPDLLRVPVTLRRLDPAFAGYRIAVVSDIHLGPLAGRAHTERIVRLVNSSEPDLIAIVGDLVDGNLATLGSAAQPMRDLAARDGAFFVTGNHEYFVDDTAEWLRELERLGVAPLRNEHTAVRRGGAAFDLIGVNDLAGESVSDGPDLDRAMRGLDGTRPSVLLAHQPVMVSRAAARGVDLQLSGHTHGGQVWPLNYVVGAVQPSVAGLSVVDDTQLYVTRGAGFWGPPVRVGAPPDITVIELRA